MHKDLRNRTLFRAVTEGKMAYEIREMAFAEILDTALRLLRDHFALLVGTSALTLLTEAPLLLSQRGSRGPTWNVRLSIRHRR